MSINKVWIEDGCSARRLCSDVCPEVFFLEGVAKVTEGPAFSDFKELIREAAESCPAEVIKYSE